MRLGIGFLRTRLVGYSANETNAFHFITPDDDAFWVWSRTDPSKNLDRSDDRLFRKTRTFAVDTTRDYCVRSFPRPGRGFKRPKPNTSGALNDTR